MWLAVYASFRSSCVCRQRMMPDRDYLQLACSLYLEIWDKQWLIFSCSSPSLSLAPSLPPSLPLLPPSLSSLLPPPSSLLPPPSSLLPPPSSPSQGYCRPPPLKRLSLVSWLALTIECLLAVAPLTKFCSSCPVPQIEFGQKNWNLQLP